MTPNTTTDSDLAAKQARDSRIILFMYLQIKGSPGEMEALTYPCPTCASETFAQCPTCLGNERIGLKTRVRLDVWESYREQQEATR